MARAILLVLLAVLLVACAPQDTSLHITIDPTLIDARPDAYEAFEAAAQEWNLARDGGKLFDLVVEIGPPVGGRSVHVTINPPNHSKCADAAPACARWWPDKGVGVGYVWIDPTTAELFYPIAVHELGHTLIVPHSENPRSVMNGVVNAGAEILEADREALWWELGL